jgi:hypothetical protein
MELLNWLASVPIAGIEAGLALGLIVLIGVMLVMRGRKSTRVLPDRQGSGLHKPKSIAATSYTSATPSFSEALKAAGWEEVVPFVEFRKRGRTIVFDTSSWMVLGNDRNPRIFDVPVPDGRLEAWTLNLIEHLFDKEDAATK